MSLLSRHIITGAGCADIGVMLACQRGPLDSGNGVYLSQITAGGPLDAPDPIPAGSVIQCGRPGTPEISVTFRWMFA